MSDEKKVWGIHTLDDNLFLKNNVIVIGWRDFGDLSKVTATRDAFKEHYAQVYPNDKLVPFLQAQVCYIDSFMRLKLEIMLYFHQKLIAW